MQIESPRTKIQGFIPSRKNTASFIPRAIILRGFLRGIKPQGKRSYPLFIVCILVFGILNLTNAHAKDKIMAIVNCDVITEKDYNDFVNFMRLQFSREMSPEELEEKISSMKEGLLNKLIEDKLILQEAKKNDCSIEIIPGRTLSIKPDESRVKARVAELKKRYSSDAEFQEELARQGLVLGDIEEKIREQLLTSSIIEVRVKNEVAVRPEEVTSFYNKNTKEFLLREELEIDCYAFDGKDLAEGFSYDLKSGKALEDLATRYPFVVNRIKAKKGGELKKEIDDAVSPLGIGEVSAPVVVDKKYYVFKLIGIIPPKQLTLPEAQDRIYGYLLDLKMKKRFSEWLADLRAKSYIKVTQD